jgi:hypothetical protein
MRHEVKAESERQRPFLFQERGHNTLSTTTVTLFYKYEKAKIIESGTTLWEALAKYNDALCG